MRDWVKSKEGGGQAQRNRAILNLSIVTLFLLMFLIASSEIISLIGASEKVKQSEKIAQGYRVREDALFALDAVLDRGLAINEFVEAMALGDLFLADSARTRLISGRQLLLSEAMAGFPTAMRTDMASLLNIYASYRLHHDETANTGMLPLNPQLDTKALISGLQSLRAYQKSWMSELSAQSVDERRLWRARSSIVVTFILLGFIPLFGGIFTSRRFAREHLQLLNTREYFTQLIDNLPGLVLLTTRSGEVLAASNAVTQYLGHSKEWYKQGTMAQLLPKRFRQQYQLYSKNYLDTKGEIVKGRELLVMNAGGKELPVELHFGHFDTSEGEVLLVCFRDVTEQRALYQRYQHLQKRFDMAMTASRDGLWDWDLISNEVLLSASWLEMMGIREGHPLNGFVVFKDSVYSEDRQRVEREVDQFLRGKDILFRTEYRLRSRDGRVCDVVSRGCALRNSEGKVLRIVGVHSDVTSFKEAEREVLRLNRNLEDRVRLRTQQLENALVSAEAANSAKAAFLSVMGHEIRTPMNGVLGMADLLAKTKLDREQQMMLNTVRSSSLSLLTTLDHILDYTALESGGVEIVPEEFQLVEFIEGIADSVGLQLAKNKQRFILHIGADVPARVSADANHLRKVVLNLIDNAIKFSVNTIPQGIIQLRLGLAADQSELPSGQQRLEINVIDNGIGISSDQRSQLFEPFVQIENSRTRRFGGTGLGLAIAARMIKLMGGRVGLTSTAGQDTCFTVKLPIDVPEILPIVEPFSDITVLACVPEKLLRNAVAAILERHGYKLQCFESTAELMTQIDELNAAAIVLVASDNQAILDCCTAQKLKVIKLSERPRDKTILGLGLVYTDPLLPSALMRALERETRLLNSIITEDDASQ
ncbi:MAG: ATP-binding protein [Zhongshania sp.]|uniref:PAS domain-containing sensor histidine kinase n=1 Tax=Zhongshania sp. TaxID=1971902 RepID=UPI0026108A94|nr:ATP-binding protein [Zhongshania sp.]MDF1691989.1 ATP-binding protein [Zhongshania sp.]